MVDKLQRLTWMKQIQDSWANCSDQTRVGHPKCQGNPRVPPKIANPPGNKALIRPYWGMMVVNNPLIRPYFLGGGWWWHFWGIPLDFHENAGDWKGKSPHKPWRWRWVGLTSCNRLRVWFVSFERHVYPVSSMDMIYIHFFCSLFLNREGLTRLS